MWESRNSSLPSDITQAQVNNHVSASASLNANYLTIAGFMDYPTALQKWVTAIRANGLKVWWRVSWDNWQGAHDAPVNMSPATYISETVDFITENPTMFADGDLFDFSIEPASATTHWNTTYGSDWSYGGGEDAIAGRAAYNTYIQDGIDDVTAAFLSIGKSGVISSIVSDVTNVVISVYTQTTINKLSAICIDYHPEGANEDIEYNVRLHRNELQRIKTTWPDKDIIYGEISYCNDHEVTDIVQAYMLGHYFNRIFRDSSIIGVNYWQGCGDNATGSRLISGSKGAWNTKRTSTQMISSFYANGGTPSRIPVV